MWACNDLSQVYRVAQLIEQNVVSSSSGRTINAESPTSNGLAHSAHSVSDLMCAMDVFVLTSLWEGLPRVLPQAMATGLPIVCTRAEGSVEAVSEDETGFLVEPGDPKAIATKIEFLLKDAASRRRMGSEGRRRVSEFCATRMIAEIDALYQRLLTRAGLNNRHVGQEELKNPR